MAGMRRCSVCGRGWFRGDHDACIRRTKNPAHVAWFERTGHCGQCGQPGNYCTCSTTIGGRCGCHDLHPVGSGLDPDALARFAETDVEQPGLFG